MKNVKAIFITAVFCGAAIIVCFAYNREQKGYILEHEKDISRNEGGPHNGTGATTAYSFFSQAHDAAITFRKRVLHPGASIGYHLQKVDEVYYILSGNGEMKMNNEVFTVIAGDAILTRPGSSHGLQQKGSENLVIIVTYPTH